MSSDAKPPARKRGRPANASKPAVASASEDHPDEYEADIEEFTHPKQRGRPRKQVAEDPAEQVVAQEGKPRRKRGRPSLEDRNAENKAEDPAQSKRKRGRPSLEKRQTEPEAEPETVENTAQPKKKRGRRALEADQNDKESANEPVEELGKAKRKRKPKERQFEHPEQPDKEPQPSKKGRRPAQQPEPEETEPAPPKRRSRKVQEPQDEEGPRRSPRNSLNDLGEDVNNKGRNAGKNDRASRENAEDRENDETTKRRGRPNGGRPSAENANEQQPEEQEQEQDINTKKIRRNKNDDPSDSDESLPSPEKPYLHIAPFKRTIRSSTIAAKWTPLSGSSLPAAASILTLAHQPILSRTSTTRNRRTHASAALHLVSRRIERKLARGLPFPPASSMTTTRRSVDADGGRAMELDFEAVLDGKTALERQLVPGRHAVKLLKAEKDRMERELDRDYEELRKLEANARAQTRERKDLFRKAHVLAPTSRPSSKDQDTAFITDNKEEGTLKDLVNTPLEPVVLQLAGHVESIRGNLQQAEGVTPQLGRTKAVLQDVLHRYLDSESYEQVVLG
ncbi:cylicin ii [Fusarium heterosporum]|uniref:Cylicin ii n=1 Tax=Fusarium heterosporum TaxID=42747 RepID=A0A8H5WWP2_FUSHE|nr:cylicin ii [Fusarium heterosporum]